MALPQVRRVVTAYDDSTGLSVFSQDKLVEKVEVRPGSTQTMFSQLWGTTSSPAQLEFANGKDGADTVGAPIVNPGGSTFRIIDSEAGKASPMHRTESLDYIIMLQGEITLELEDGQKTVLKAGDVAIQQGTLHKWINHTQETARFACIALPAGPVQIAGKSLAGPVLP
ncbi:hypothetical protein P389DRAFT_197728 [Cystobasidium minutum MCA 4210]|uniref:uncharacterized protein n=1 Tax=Cystobasidium minutum MCA 4210 TaxID=1397322 RepID=UPI0034CEB373|eukprot:jgi/Rhomi1/197728/gm1.5942_g